MEGFGPTIDDRALTIWHISTYYRERKQSTDKLKALPVSRFRTKPPCLKGMGATIRKLVPFFVQLVSKLDVSNDEHQAVMSGMFALDQCYQCLSHSARLPPNHLRDQAALFGQRLVYLHQMNPERYHILPKLHMFEELCSLGVRPSNNWLYREEDFGGSLSAMSHRDGGMDTALAASRLCLNRFCLNQDMPALLPEAQQTSSSSSSSGAVL